MTEQRRPSEPALELLAAIAARAEAAGRLEPPGGAAVLRSIVDATVVLFDAEASSIALYDAATDRLVFRVAAGAQGQGVVGVSIAPHEGVAGYVFSTGQPIAIVDVAADPRFGASTAQQTGYVPRSILAVPLIDDEDSLGVLEILDRRSGEGFALRDVELAGVFARQATVAIRATRLERDTATLLRDGLRALASHGTVPVSEEPLEELVEAATAQLGFRRRPAVGPRRPRRPAARCRPGPGRVAGRPARRPHPSRGTPATGAGRAMTPGLEALPAWSEPFATDARAALERALPLGVVDREAAFGGTDGSGVRVAIIDSGVEAAHPAVGGRLRASMVVEIDGDDAAVIEDGTAVDVVGHGTACAGIVHAIAPGAELVSVRVLGPNNRAKGHSFAAAIEWVVGQGIGVANLSLSSRSESLAGLFHELADRAYFANTLLICAANNVPGPSYPSLFASVVSVAAHDVADPAVWFYNPSPPVEFGAYGVDVDVAWRGGGRIRATGNSFAAPHLAGYAARIRARHPKATPFEVKAILAATATPITT